MKIIVGLGNPGKKYEKTRHNVGFLALDYFANINNLVFEKTKFDALYLETVINQEKVILVKPQMFMNLSGLAVAKFVKFYNAKLTDLLIIHDDLDLNLGNIKIKRKGSSGGHNGLKNIEQYLSSSEYSRVKVGISKSEIMSTSDYVLKKFSVNELKVINKQLPVIENIILDFLVLDIEKLMSKYN